MNVAWTIGGSDSGGGAGIQADLKTMNGLGVHGCSAITAVTAQNTLGVFRVESVTSDMLRHQLQVLWDDLPPKVIKLGMLYSGDLAFVVSEFFIRQKIPVVCDPVMVATTGEPLSSENLVDILRKQIIPYSTLVTPNLIEAHELVGKNIELFLRLENEYERDRYIESLADELLQLGPSSVLLKGGHRDGLYSQDFWTNGKSKAWLTSTKRETKNTHGTGCTLSAAITAALALDYSMLDALVIGKAYVNQGLRLAQNVGSGGGSLAHLSWPESEEDLPWITRSAGEGRHRPKFALDLNIRFYPIVNRARWIRILSESGVRTIQLRIKDLRDEELEKEIIEAIYLAKQNSCNLYINDHWRLAIKHHAYGVHLGQEDLDDADAFEIVASGLRLGLSTHNYAEVSRALSYQPSYIAIGPIFPTTTKDMHHNPQGTFLLQRWRRSLSYPLVAIGGIFLSNAAEILACNVESIAVVRDIMDATEPTQRAKEWQQLFGVLSFR